MAGREAYHPTNDRRVAANGRSVVLYLINQYPAVTHTFIKREVQALERQDVEVVRVAARAGRALVDPGDVLEEQRTTYLIRQPLDLLRALAELMLLRPLSFAKAFVTTMSLMRRSDRGPLLHILYLVEACKVASIVRATGAAHIHAHFGTNPAELALLAAQLSGVTYSFTVHGYDEYDKPEFIGLWAKIHEAAFVATVSHYGRSQLYRWCDAADRSKIKLIRCGLDRTFYDMAEDKPSTAARLVCVGRLCREKGQSILVKAAAMVATAGRKFELVIVGDGEGRAELEELIAEYGLSDSIRLCGWLSSADVRREMLSARALVVASLAENLPVVIMEAMALRRPVIATQIAGVPELVVSRETGWLVPAGCPEALAAAMTDCLLAPSETLHSMGRLSRERVMALHDVDREATVLMELFAELTSRRAGPPGAARPLTTAIQ
ncbi:colanic acid biosynthesis glycosyltransferase WcaL [Bradyrhizobium sp. UFLA03-84]|nr:colanic acid biosynthesis glycosyltransferase WcaL [Bradyrhizobium sp. UFLA03-84]